MQDLNFPISTFDFRRKLSSNLHRILASLPHALVPRPRDSRYARTRGRSTRAYSIAICILFRVVTIKVKTACTWRTGHETSRLGNPWNDCDSEVLDSFPVPKGLTPATDLLPIGQNTIIVVFIVEPNVQQ